jgi:hypothetical protein
MTVFDDIIFFVQLIGMILILISFFKKKKWKPKLIRIIDWMFVLSLSIEWIIDIIKGSSKIVVLVEGLVLMFWIFLLQQAIKEKKETEDEPR